MTTIAAAELLAAWERGTTASAGERALLLLSAAHPEEADLPRWAVGTRDRALLSLRERLFGTRLAGLVPCPGCGGTMEIECSVPDLVAGATVPAVSTMEVFSSGFRVEFRLPSAADMAALGRNPGADERWLLDRCLLAIHGPGGTADVSPAGLPDEVATAVADAMAEADPLASIELALACPDCGRDGVVLFDIVNFLWSELDVWAVRLLSDVATLACAYGWSERDILALSQWRRDHYVELAAR